MSIRYDRQAQDRATTTAALPAHRGATSKEAISVALLLFVLSAVFFWPAVFGGRALLPVDLIFDVDPLWQPLAPGGYVSPSNHLLSDQVLQFFPWRTFATRWLLRGELPLWNPYVDAGDPFVGNAQSALFDPLQAPTYLLAAFWPSAAYTAPVLAAVLRLFVAGLFTYLLAREIGLSIPAALLAMVAFAFSGALVVWIGHPIGSVIVWLPAMLWTVERALTTRRRVYIIACGLTVAAQFLGGHPETSFLVMLTWSAYATYRAVALEGWRPLRLWSQFARIAVAAIIGVSLAAVQLLPFAEALFHSATIVSRRTASAADVPALLQAILVEWQQWPTAIAVLLPQYFGTPLDNSYWWPYSNYVEQSVYAGVLPLALVITMALHSAKRDSSPRYRCALFFLLLAACALGIALRLPLLNAINYAPLFRLSANGRLRLVAVFAFALLGGIGLDTVTADTREDQRTTDRILVALGLGSLLLVGLAYVGFVLFREEILDSGRTFMESNWGTPYFSRPLEHYYALVEERYEKKLALFSPRNVVMYLPVLVAIAWLALRRWMGRPRLNWTWTSAVLALTFLDLYLVGASFNPTVAPDDIFPTPDAIQFLQRDPDVYRVLGTGAILNPNSGMMFDIYDVRGYETVVPRRYTDLIERTQGHFRSHFHSLFTEATSPLLDLLNVKYVLTDQQLEAQWELLHGDAEDLSIYLNRNVLPRAFVVYRIVVASSPSQSLAWVTDGTFDFRTAVVLEEAPTGWVEPATLPAVMPSVHMLDYQPNRVTIEAETVIDGLLVLTDTYMPGWKAWIDGHTTHVYVADHAFRAVVVPAGTHRIEFAYRPLSFQVGAAISLSTAAALSLALSVPWLARTGGPAR